MDKILRFECSSISGLGLIAREILGESRQRKFALTGPLGAGKTTLIKAFCKQLGVTGIVNSPTFTLLNEYRGIQKVYHFDFYRIKEASEILSLGFTEIFHSDGYVFIEWPEKAGEYIPDFFTQIDMEIINRSTRLIVCK